MAVPYLHGVETVEVNSGSSPISVVKTAVIALSGIAPAGAVNTPIVVNSPNQAAQFGFEIPGFSIPQSLDAIFKQGAGTVVVVNVFDPDKHTTQITDEQKTVTDGALKLAYAPIGEVSIKDSNDAAVTFIKDVDYTIDAFGNFMVISSAIANSVLLKFSYKRLDESKVLPADIIGTFDPDDDSRTGMKCFELCYNLFGFTPKILIAPTFSQVDAVANELIALSDKYRAINYLDAPAGTTVATAIAGRGPLGTINFNTSNGRTELLYPHLKKYDVATDSDVIFPYSAFKAGLRAAVDIEEGYWVSDSNHEIKGITGVEVALTAAINDASTDVNRLNEVGISTVFNSLGTGIRSWGNRNSSYPTSKKIDSFSAVRRVADIVAESIELASLDNIDKPINQGWIDDVVESVNNFIRTLIRRGAIIDGNCWFNKDDNPTSELQQGKVVFGYDLCPPPPAERMTFMQHINAEYLATLK